MWGVMFGTRRAASKDPAILFLDGDLLDARMVLVEATRLLLHEMRIAGDVTKATLAVNAACNAVETMCEYGMPRGYA